MQSYILHSTSVNKNTQLVFIHASKKKKKKKKNYGIAFFFFFFFFYIFHDYWLNV